MVTDSFKQYKPKTLPFHFRLFAVNVKPIICVSQVVAKHWISSGKGGSIVNLSTICTTRATGDTIVYSGTKGAVEAMTKVMALELGPKKV